MSTLLSIFYGLLLMAAGIGILKYRNKVHNFVGNWVWAERYLGSGGTITALIFIGMLLIVVGFLYPFGGLDYLLGTQDSTVQPGFSR